VKQQKHTHKTVLWPFFWDHPGEPVPEKNLDFMVQGKINRGRHKTIRIGAALSGLSNAHLHHPNFLQARCPSCHPTNSVKAQKAETA